MFFSSLATADSLENLAVELAMVRGSVEELQGQLDQEKEGHHNRMQILSSQLTDLSVEQRRQNVSIKKMKQSIEKYVELNTQANDSGKTLKPIILKVLDDYKLFVVKGLPFKDLTVLDLGTIDSIYFSGTLRYKYKI